MKYWQVLLIFALSIIIILGVLDSLTFKSKHSKRIIKFVKELLEELLQHAP